MRCRNKVRTEHTPSDSTQTASLRRPSPRFRSLLPPLHIPPSHPLLSSSRSLSPTCLRKLQLGTCRSRAPARLFRLLGRTSQLRAESPTKTGFSHVRSTHPSSASTGRTSRERLHKTFLPWSLTASRPSLRVLINDGPFVCRHLLHTCQRVSSLSYWLSHTHTRTHGNACAPMYACPYTAISLAAHHETGYLSRDLHSSVPSTRYYRR
ncbi:hypothetical protein LZ30DRAFT_704485 [Colletotrichum cereale]|nr:hypothetical protein LZ30DRAFT_704485 [Colletotrichum cereale]